MPRFNIKKYSPANDSSAVFAKNDSGYVDLLVDEDRGRMTCLCGCGHPPTGVKTLFCMGHDARLRGVLIRAHLVGTHIRFLNRKEQPIFPTREPHPEVPSEGSAMDVAAPLGWAKYLESASARKIRRGEDLVKSVIGSKRLIKVGRWEYTGEVAAILSTPDGDRLEVKYLTKTGEIKTALVNAS